MTLTKTEKEILQDMKGHEIAYKDQVVMLDYPFVIASGKRKMYSDRTWKSIYNVYWNDSRNEGYWLKRELHQY